MVINEEAKIAVMQERIKNLDLSVNRILDNHLPHLQKDIQDLSKKMDTNYDRIDEKLNDLRITIAKYIGIAIGGIGILEIAIKLLSK